MGEIRNSGVELTANANVISTKDLTWTINFNISANHNDLVKLSDKQGIDTIVVTNSGPGFQILIPGKSAFDWYMPKWVGVNPDDGTPMWEKVNIDPATGEVTGNGNNLRLQ